MATTIQRTPQPIDTPPPDPAAAKAPAKAKVDAKTNPIPAEADPATRAQAQKNQSPPKAGAKAPAWVGLNPAEQKAAKQIVATLDADYAKKPGRAGNAQVGEHLALAFANQPRLAGAVIKQLGAKFDWPALIRDTPNNQVKEALANQAWPYLDDAQKKGAISQLGQAGCTHAVSSHIMFELTAGRNPASLVVEAGRSGVSFNDLRAQVAESPQLQSVLDHWWAGELQSMPAVAAAFTASDDDKSALAKADPPITHRDIEQLISGTVPASVKQFLQSHAGSSDPAFNHAASILVKAEAAGATARQKIEHAESGEAHNAETSAKLDAESAHEQKMIDADNKGAKVFDTRANASPEQRLAGELRNAYAQKSLSKATIQGIWDRASVLPNTAKRQFAHDAMLAGMHRWYDLGDQRKLLDGVQIKDPELNARFAAEGFFFNNKMISAEAAINDGRQFSDYMKTQYPGMKQEYLDQPWIDEMRHDQKFAEAMSDLADRQPPSDNSKEAGRLFKLAFP